MRPSVIFAFIKVMLIFFQFEGKMTLSAGGQQPNQKTKASSNVLQTEFEIER